MDDRKFDLLMQVLEILEKRNPSTTMVESILEIIDNFDSELTPEQRSSIFKMFLRFRRREEEDHFKRYEYFR